MHNDQDHHNALIHSDPSAKIDTEYYELRTPKVQ